MPWVEPSEPHASPPRVPKPGPLVEWDGTLVDDRGAIDLVDVEVVRPEALDLGGCHELGVRDSLIVGATLSSAGDLALEVHRSVLDGCDLSSSTIASLRTSRLIDCKLIGTDFTGTTVADVAFERCVFRYSSWRMARFQRVSFVDCLIDDVDAFEVVLEDVDLPGTTVAGLNVDRLEATRVDLRSAAQIDLRGIVGLSGCLLSEHQLPAMAAALALAAGADIEKPVVVPDP